MHVYLFPSEKNSKIVSSSLFIHLFVPVYLQLFVCALRKQKSFGVWFGGGILWKSNSEFHYRANIFRTACLTMAIQFPFRMDACICICVYFLLFHFVDKIHNICMHTHNTVCVYTRLVCMICLNVFIRVFTAWQSQSQHTKSRNKHESGWLCLCLCRCAYVCVCLIEIPNICIRKEYWFVVVTRSLTHSQYSFVSICRVFCLFICFTHPGFYNFVCSFAWSF